MDEAVDKPVDDDRPACSGPLYWYGCPVTQADREDGQMAQALVECQAQGCGFQLVSPTPMDRRHQEAPLIRSPHDREIPDRL